MIEQNDMIHDTEVEVYHEILIRIKIIFHKIDIVLHLEIDLVMTRILLSHNTHDYDMTIIKQIRDPLAHLTGHPTDPPIDMTLVTDIDQVRIQEITTNLQDNTSSFRPPSRPRDSRSSRSRSHYNTRNKLNTKHPQTQNDRINFGVHMYHPTKVANALKPSSWLYSLYTHTPSNQTKLPIKIRNFIPSGLRCFDISIKLSLCNFCKT